MDPKQLLESFLGSGAGATATDLLGQARARIDQLSPGGALAGGAAAGGLLALLLGNKRAAGLGSAAALGALALKAYQSWQARQGTEAPPPVPQPAGATPALPFELSLIRAMIGAAGADGHIDAAERKRIAEKVEALRLDAEGKAFIFDATNDPPGPEAIAVGARTPEQATQLWLAARLAVDPDDPAERSFLDRLANRLALPAELVGELEREAAKVSGPVA